MKTRTALRNMMVGAGTIAALVIAAAAPVSAAPTAGPGTMTVNHTEVLASSSGNDFIFTYTPTGSGIARGTLKLVIPAGWPAPQKKKPTQAGFVQASAGKLTVSKSTISVKKVTVCNTCTDTTVTVGYTDVTAPAVGSISTFVASALAKGKKARPLTSEPTVTVATLPNAPGISTVTPASGQLTFQLTAATAFPAVSSYTVTCGSQSATIDGLTVTVTGLTNGTSYSCFAFATNSGGNGPDSASVSEEPNSQLPAAPSVTSRYEGESYLTVYFTAPSNPPETITGYTATCAGSGATFSGTGDTSATSVTVTGLTSRTSYSCTLYASDAAGNGASADWGGTTSGPE